jgi:hypothetical protein
MPARKIVLAAGLLLLCGTAARADVLITPPLVAEGDNVLDCYLANVGPGKKNVRIEAITAEGEVAKFLNTTLEPGQEKVVRTTAEEAARYCKFTVSGAGKNYRGSVLVRDNGVGAISALAAF